MLSMNGKSIAIAANIAVITHATVFLLAECATS